MTTLQQAKAIQEYCLKNGYSCMKLIDKPASFSGIKKLCGFKPGEIRLQIRVSSLYHSSTQRMIQAIIEYTRVQPYVTDMNSVCIRKDVKDYEDFLDFEKRATKAEVVAKIFRINI